MTPHLLLDIVVPAKSAFEAEEAAKAWAAAEPKIVLVRLTRVRPATGPSAVDRYGWPSKWTVELEYTAVESDQLQAGL